MEPPPPHPTLLGSRTSGHDGSSEGGRISTGRLPSWLVLYAVPLLEEVRRGGYKGKINAEPVLERGTWCLKVVYDGDKPKGVPEVWHGHRVILEKAKPAVPPS